VTLRTELPQASRVSMPLAASGAINVRCPRLYEVKLEILPGRTCRNAVRIFLARIRERFAWAGVNRQTES